MKDDVDRIAAESAIQNFGQTPSQLIMKDPHPSRYALELSWKPLINNVSFAYIQMRSNDFTAISCTERNLTVVNDTKYFKSISIVGCNFSATALSHTSTAVRREKCSRGRCRRENSCKLRLPHCRVFGSQGWLFLVVSKNP